MLRLTGHWKEEMCVNLTCDYTAELDCSLCAEVCFHAACQDMVCVISQLRLRIYLLVLTQILMLVLQIPTTAYTVFHSHDFRSGEGCWKPWPVFAGTPQKDHSPSHWQSLCWKKLLHQLVSGSFSGKVVHRGCVVSDLSAYIQTRLNFDFI